MTNIKKLRRDIDDFMKYAHQSPLNPEQRRKFRGLSYYEYNQDLAFEVEAERFAEDTPSILMQTSTGDSREYKKWGKVRFTLDGEEAVLTIYEDEYGDFFLPFKDSTNGEETYGAGRYLDSHRPGIIHSYGNHIILDLNYSFNPYCAYNPNYSCPLPPRENWLAVPIRAGEKNFS